mgnify:CR=1 FL=1
MRPPLVVIAGPTASGKSALAEQLAADVGGVVINADASQVYRDIPVLSAAPGDGGPRHRLYGFRDGAEPLTAAGWAELAKIEIAAAQAAGRLPILVGGTGLYIRTLIDGIAPVPPIDPAIRSEVRAAEVAENRRALATLDPAAAARLAPGDTARIARALEVVRSTGRTLGEWQSERVGGIGGSVKVRGLVLTPPRDWLYARCDARFAAMAAGGAVGEVERLLKGGLDPRLPVMRAIGVAEIARFLGGAWAIEDAVAAGQQATRRYAKRQYTWFAHQPPPEWTRFGEPLDAPGAAERALELLGLER